MRNSIFVVLFSVLFALPLAAQAAPEFTAPSDAELTELKQHHDKALGDVRGGDSNQRAVLSDAERKRIETMLGGKIQDVQMLGMVRAGSHFHVHWGVWVAIPCTCGTIALLLLVLLLL